MGIIKFITVFIIRGEFLGICGGNFWRKVGDEGELEWFWGWWIVGSFVVNGFNIQNRINTYGKLQNRTLSLIKCGTNLR